MGNGPSVSRCSELDHAPTSKKRALQQDHGNEQTTYWYEKMQESQASQELFEACARGNIKAAMTALVQHGNPNCCNADGLTSLMMSAAGGHLEVARLLVTSGAKVNAVPCRYGVSPIGLASAQGHCEIAALLLQWKADANVGRASGNAPLSRAAAVGHVQVCQLLLEHGADPDASDERGATALMQAVEHERLEAAQLLVTAGASAVRADNRSRSALSRVIDILLGMDPHGKGAGALRNPLTEFDYWAEMASIMVERQADVDIVDSKGGTPLFHAVARRRNDVVLLLLGLRADRDFPVPALRGGTALLRAVEDGQMDLCQTLVLRSASVNQPTSGGVTPLCRAIEKGHEDICFYLLRNGAQYDLRDPRTGEALLTKAAASGLRRLYDYLRQYVATEAVALVREPAAQAEENGEYEYVPDASGENSGSD